MSPENAPMSRESFERELLQLLRFGGLDKENLNELVKTVATFHREGLRPVKVFPIGIPVVDGLEANGIVELNTLVALLKRILVETPRTTGLSVFPYGIPNPEVFQVNVRLGGIRER